MEILLKCSFLIQALMKMYAFEVVRSFPRIVFPPLKRSSNLGFTVIAFVFASCSAFLIHLWAKLNKTLRGLSPHANYTDRAAAAGRRS